MKHSTRSWTFVALASCTALLLACGSGGNPEDDTRPLLNLEAARTVTSPPAEAAGPPTPTPLPVLPSLTVHVVEPGDTPLLIAEQAGVPPEERDAWIAEMLALNGVTGQTLQAGQKLILPPPGLSTIA